jgi:hypothetical protein
VEVCREVVVDLVFLSSKLLMKFVDEVRDDRREDVVDRRQSLLMMS